MTLEVELRHSHGDFALDVAFGAGAARVTALFGPSGSGKTSIVNAVAGLLRPRDGRIVLDGETLFDSARGIDRPARQRGIGYVFQDARLFPHLSVRRNLLFGWRRGGRRATPAEIGHIVEMLGIGHLLKRRPAALSGGERQRVALGRTLLRQPRFLLLDEPLAALDYKRREEILPYLERLRDEERVPMLYVSHAMGEVARLADTVLLIDHGRIVGTGGVGDVFSDLDVLASENGAEAAAIFPAVVDHHIPDYGLSVLTIQGGSLSVPQVAVPPGSALRVRVRAVDVTLALHPPEGLSANNVLAAVVSDIRAEGPTFANVQLAAGDHRFLARITRLSADRLQLRTGAEVHAIIKSVQVLR